MLHIQTHIQNTSTSKHTNIPSSSSMVTVVLMGMISVCGSVVVMLTKSSSFLSYSSSSMMVRLKHALLTSGPKVKVTGVATKSDPSVVIVV